MRIIQARVLAPLAAVALVAAACGAETDGVGVSDRFNNTSINNFTNNNSTGNNTGGNNNTTGNNNTGMNNTTGGNNTTGNNNTGMNNPGNNGLGTEGVGDACSDELLCRPGLACNDSNVCEPDMSLAVGQPCQISLECQEGLYCSPVGVCQPAGEGELGATCTGSQDCLQGLICVPEALSGLCGEGGEGDTGDSCTSFLDCLPGLGCGMPRDGGGLQCLSGPNGGFPLPFEGVECGEDEGDLRVYFEADENEEPADWFRRPFPSDLRVRADGTLDLTNHPTPGVSLLGFDIVQAMLDIVEEDQLRFGLNQAITFRFSGRVNFETVQPNGETPSLYIVDITPGSAEYNQRQPLYWRASSGRGKYICNNWMAVRPSWGRPLNANTTYALIVTSAVTGSEGEALTPAEDFTAMLNGSDPGGGLSRPWTKYQPLRDWIGAEGINSSELMVGIVFTTGDPRAIPKSLNASVAAADAVTVTEPTVVCDTGVASPCDDGLEGDEHVRGCFAANANFTEAQGKLRMPIFQNGDAPYSRSGGDIAFSGASANVQRYEDVCFSMTVPAADPPENGFPVLIYAHGTGGNYRGHVNSLGDLLTTIDVNGTPVQFVTIGWDQVLHHDRRGDSTQDPNFLVYNVLNPRGSRGSFLQAAAEVHAVVRFVEEHDFAANSPTGEAVPIDTSQIYFMGHSQGGTSGPIALPFAPSVRGTVLSGSGGGFALSLGSKISPVNIPAAVALAIQEDPESIQDTHPVLNILQGYYDAVDPVNYAEYIGTRRLPDPVNNGEFLTSPRHVFHTFGIGDTYTPKLTLETMATALRLQMILPFEEEFERGFVSDTTLPAGSNAAVAGERYSVIGRQYTPSDYDGHFVIFRHDTARDDLQEFLGTAVVDGIPEIAD